MSENHGSNGNNGGNGSLRSLVASNEEAMHKMASRLGELGAVRSGLTGLKQDLDGQLKATFQSIQTMLEGEQGIKGTLVKAESNLKMEIVTTQGKISDVASKVKSEVEKREDLEKKVEELTKALNKRSRWQRYYWGGVGVLIVSLVGCLGYFSYELNNISGSLQKAKIRTVVEPGVTANNTLLPNLPQQASKEKDRKAKNKPRN